jgi:hypothetical protein
VDAQGDNGPPADPAAGGDGVENTPGTYDLSGFWDDNGRTVRITHTGTEVVATFTQPYICDHEDGPVPPGESPDAGAVTSETTLDFRATLVGDVMSGETNVCNWETGGAVHEFGAGLMLTDIELTVSADGNRLVGTWYNPHDDVDEPVTITRIEAPEAARLASEISTGVRR